MNKTTKKYLSLLLVITMLLGCFSISFTAFSGDEVEINATNFPDPVFRAFVTERYDSNRNGYLSAEERNVSNMPISGYLDDDQEIKTLKGIEYFANSLSILRCAYIGLEELDVSALFNLTSLTCMGNRLKTLDVSKNTKLVSLNCSDNKLTSLTLGSLTALDMLHCYVNKIASLDVSALENLTDLRCDQNELTAIDVSKNTRLKEFTCSKNHLISLDLSYNTSLNAVVGPAIGGQTTTAQAILNGVEILIPFEVDNRNNITSTSLDSEGYLAYYLGQFHTNNFNNLVDGLDYTYSTSLANSEDMSVHVDVSREFFEVRFFADEQMKELLGVRYVEPNESPFAPEIPLMQCKAFDRWSEDITNVTEDMKVYIIWSDNHSYELTNFENDIATISCSVCGDSFTVRFSDCISTKADDENYCEYLDVVADGYISAKDYAKLIQMFQ